MISSPPKRVFSAVFSAGAVSPAAIRPQLPQAARPARPWYTLGQIIGRLLMLFLLLIGLCTVFDDTVGDGALPHFNDLKTTAPKLSAEARRNTTAQLTQLTPPAAWQSLGPSRDLLTALSPEIAAWLYELHRQNRIVYAAPTDAYGTYQVSADTPILAAYRHGDGTLYLGRDFWRLSDGQKVVVLAHEYRHYRQNAPKRISHLLAQLLGGGLRYNSRIEDEAFAYERQAQAALGI